MSGCVIKVCRNYKGRSKTTHNVTYHRIPSDPVLRSRWIDIIRKSRREELWKPAKYALVCSDHFHKNDMYFANKHARRKLKKTAVPCKALFLSSVQSDGSDVTDEDIDASDENAENTFIEINSSTIDAGSSGISRDVQHVSSMEMGDTSDASEICNKDSKNTLNNTENETEDLEEYSDLDSIFDTPMEAKLRQQLVRKNMLQKKHILRIQSLRRKNIRLRKKIASLKKNLENLKNSRKNKDNMGQ